MTADTQPTLQRPGPKERVAKIDGLVAGFARRNYLLPRTGRAVISFRATDPRIMVIPLKPRGITDDVLSMVNCQ